MYLMPNRPRATAAATPGTPAAWRLRAAPGAGATSAGSGGVGVSCPGRGAWWVVTSHRWDELAAVFAGGVVGALLRAGLGEALPHGADGWPGGTFVANLAGTALLAWLFFHVHHGLPADARRRRLFEPGLCGALTTFSTFQLELLRLFDQGAVGVGVAYAVASIGLGFGVAWLGVHLTRARRGAAAAGAGGDDSGRLGEQEMQTGGARR